MNRALWMKAVISLAAAATVLFLPPAALGIEGLTELQQRVMATFVLAMFFWVLEPVPIFATSVMVVVIELLFMSDKGIVGLIPKETLKYKEVLNNFADPVIMLFLGGFFLADAATKYKLDMNLGRVFLRPFGTRTKWVLLGVMTVTAVFSMFMSNTATTAMMLAVLLPVLRSIDPKDPARIAFALSIPFAANIGGIGTPIGTPPNAVAMKYITAKLLDPAATSSAPLIGFTQWMIFAVPYVIILLIASWLILLFFFKPKADRIIVDFSGKWINSPKAWVVYITGGLTIALWMFGESMLGMNSSVVAMIPVAVFTMTGVITSSEVNKMSWDVLWLVAGGFALGMGLEKSGLAQAMVNSIPFDALPAIAVTTLACVLGFAMANFMSHTATANLILPVMATLATALPSLDSIGGPVMLLLAVTFCTSLSMSLPISTPPNAMAFATGWVTTPQMAKAGLATGIVGLLLLAAMVALLQVFGFFAQFQAPLTP